MDRFTKIFLGFIALLVVIIILIVFVATRPKNSRLYDTSDMQAVTVSDILDMFDDKGTYVLMFGEESCEACADIVPKMIEAQEELNYKTRYIDILSIDFESSTWKEVADKLSMKSTQSISEDDTGELETNTYGYFLSTYAFAPTVVIIKDGEQVGGFIGGVDVENLIPWLKIKIS